MANPPFNQKEWRGNDELIDDPRWNGYEVPPTSNANYGWILNIVSKLSQNGVAGFLLANGALSDDGTELKIRQQLIENNLVEAVVLYSLHPSLDVSFRAESAPIDCSAHPQRTILLDLRSRFRFRSRLRIGSRNFRTRVRGRSRRSGLFTCREKHAHAEKCCQYPFHLHSFL